MSLSLKRLDWFKGKLHYHLYFSKAREAPQSPKGYWGLIDDIDQATTLDEIGHLSDKIAWRYGYNHAGSAFLYPKGDQHFVCHHIYQRQSPWIDYYREHLMFVDPFSDHCIHSALPLTWHQDATHEQQLRAVAPAMMSAFYDFTINNTVSIPYHGPGGTFGCLRLVCLHNHRLSPRDMRHSLPELESLTRHLLGAVGRILVMPGSDYPQPLVQLTEKELAILTLMVKGKSVPTIARHLEVSVNTVSTHVKRIYRKLAVNNRQLAVVNAILLGLVIV